MRVLIVLVFLIISIPVQAYECRRHDVDIYGNCPGPDPRSKFKDFFREDIPDWFKNDVPEWFKGTAHDLKDTLKHWSVVTSGKAVKGSVLALSPVANIHENHQQMAVNAAKMGAAIMGIFTGLKSMLAVVRHGSGNGGELNQIDRQQLEDDIDRQPFNGTIEVVWGRINNTSLSLVLRVGHNIYNMVNGNVVTVDLNVLIVGGNRIRCTFYPFNAATNGIAHDITVNTASYVIMTTEGVRLTVAEMQDPLIMGVIRSQFHVCDEVLQTLSLVHLMP